MTADALDAVVRHGTLTAYKNGCHCDDCRAESTRVRKFHRMGLSRKVDGQPARDHVKHLRQHGMSLRDIAVRAGLDYTAIFNIYHGHSQRLFPRTAQAILAVEPEAGHAFMDATGARRRVQALIALGWTARQIAARIGQYNGLRTCNVQRIITATQVTGITAAAVRHVYDAMSMIVPPDTDGARRARARAARSGWAPPLAWDDEQLDDPAAKPDLGEKVSRDEALVEDMKFLERVEGLDLDQMAERLGVTRDYLTKARRTHRKRTQGDVA